MGADAPIPQNTMNAAAPTGRPRGGIDTRNIKQSCPTVPRRGPEAGEHHITHFLLSYHIHTKSRRAINELSPPELLVSAGKVLGGKRTEQGEFPGQDACTDDLCEFPGIGPGGITASGNAEYTEAFLLCF